jgi:hypothetical protein
MGEVRNTYKILVRKNYFTTEVINNLNLFLNNLNIVFNPLNSGTYDMFRQV